MIVLLAFVAAVLTAIQGNVVSPAADRQGNVNVYSLFTRNYVATAIIMPALSVFQLNSDFEFPALNKDHETIVIVHGHGGDSFSSYIKNEFLSEGRASKPVNVIVLDWSSQAQLSYSFASASVASVGTALGDYLGTLAEQDRISLSQLHLIGFNLGAHVVGFAGRRLGGQVARITGLDPSRSQWTNNPFSLNKNDALYVEVLHTDGDGLLANGIGTAIGDVDFFVNGGSNQPGCLTRSCCHNRAWQVFAATLNREEPLNGNACSGNLQMTLDRCGAGAILAVGGDALQKLYGHSSIYRVNTGSQNPF